MASPTAIAPEELAAATSFTPVRLLTYLGEKQQPCTVAGTVLLADLAQFTRLTEALAAKAGTDGASLVGSDLNVALAPVIDAIVRHGGEVVKFSGDGLLCVFLASASRLDSAVRAARDVIASVVRGPDGTCHRFRVAIVDGSVTLAEFGGHRGRLEVVAGGAAVERAQQEIGRVEPGSVGRPIELARLGPATAVTHTQRDWVASSYVPEFVTARLRVDLSEWLQELRTLSVLFASLELTSSHDALQATAVELQRIVDRQGGQLLRFSLEGTGLVAEVTFGLTIGVGATGPNEAIQCAEVLIRRLCGVRVGVSTGRVLLGPIGSESRRQLTVLGATVNLAARLMQTAGSNEALIDERTWESAIARPIGTRGDAVLKGLGSRSFWKIGIADAGEPGAGEGFYGRDAEIATLGAALARIEGAPQPIVLQGDAGIGKSRVCRWLTSEIRAQGAAVWSAAATPVGRDTPYSALASTFADLCGLQPEMNVAQRLRRVAADALGDAERAPLLGDALGLSMDESEKTALLHGSVRAENIREALVLLLCRRSDRDATALIVEDAHWLDSASWALLQRLVHEEQAPRIVLVTRPMGALEPPELEGIRARGALTLELAPLAASDIASVVAAQMKVDEVPAQLARWIDERAQGNPFFAQELSAMLAGLGLLDIRERRIQHVPLASELADLPLARTIESTLEQRIDRLRVEDAAALKVASVIGPTFNRELLLELAPRSAAASAEAAIDRLVAENMVVRDAAGQLSFRHRYTQEAAYRMLPVEQRRTLHRRVAQWLETRLADRAEERAGEIAHHWFESGAGTQAIRWLDIAGVQALRTGADREAATHFRRLIGIGGEEPAGRRATWQRQLARALFGLGEIERVAQHARIAVELIGQRLPVTARGWIWFSVRSSLQRLVGIGVSTHARSVDEMLEGARSAGLLAESAYFLNAPEMMVGGALMAVGFADRTVTVAPVSVAYGMLGMVAGMARLHGVARRYLERGRALAEKGGDPFQVGVAWFYSAMYLACIGDWQGCLAASQRALAITEALGADMQSGFQLTLIATNALYTSEYANTRAWMETVRQRAERSANVQQLGWASNVVSVIHLHQGDYAGAIDRSERARQIFLVERDLISLIISEGIQCAALARNGDLEGAIIAADRAVSLVAQARPTTWGQLEGFAGPCEAYALAGGRAGVDPARVGTALGGLRFFALVFPFGQPRYLWIKGLFSVSSGAHGAARRRFRRAIAEARRWKMPFEEWRATVLLADVVDAKEAESLRAQAGRLHAAIRCADA